MFHRWTVTPARFSFNDLEIVANKYAIGKNSTPLSLTFASRSSAGRPSCVLPSAVALVLILRKHRKTDHVRALR